MNIIKKITFILILTLSFLGCNKEEEIITHTVVFDSKGGTPIDNQTVKDGSLIIKPKDPEKKDYTFDGWKMNGSRFNFKAPIRQDIRLEAAWDENTIE